MKQIPNESRSLWRDFQLEAFPPLTEDLKTEVTVIGSGIDRERSGVLCKTWYQWSLGQRNPASISGGLRY
ncbi:hypothetical protein ACJROX_25425 [Pseudalkalibacillus sp. A8]|uniref:hypothetical protein n=1 Tax=Pseudalkalibacillus sp. A8 TaxID=3382641 RepID=UPI0038B45A3D